MLSGYGVIFQTVIVTERENDKFALTDYYVAGQRPIANLTGRCYI